MPDDFSSYSLCSISIHSQYDSKAVRAVSSTVKLSGVVSLYIFVLSFTSILSTTLRKVVVSAESASRSSIMSSLYSATEISSHSSPSIAVILY